MKTLLLCLLTPLLACLFHGAGATQQEKPLPLAESRLQLFVPLIGRVWRGDFPGGAVQDTQEFEWMLGRKFVRNLHRVTNSKGEVIYEGETVYGWDFETEQLRWWYFNSTGGHVIGDLIEENGAWVAKGVNHGPKGQVGRVRSDLRIDADRWTSTSFKPAGEDWTKEFTMEFVVVN
jgi:hypothetical protein